MFIRFMKAAFSLLSLLGRTIVATLFTLCLLSCTKPVSDSAPSPLLPSEAVAPEVEPASAAMLQTPQAPSEIDEVPTPTPDVKLPRFIVKAINPQPKQRASIKIINPKQNFSPLPDPEAQRAVANENPEPTPVSENAKGYLFDRITISALAGYLGIESQTAAGDIARLNSELLLGVSVRLEQHMTSEFKIIGKFSIEKYSFPKAPSPTVTNDFEGLSIAASYGAEWVVAEKTRVGLKAGIADDFAVLLDDPTATATLIKLTHPSLGLSLSQTLWQNEVGLLEVTPEVDYALGATSGSVTSSAHLVYSLELKATKLSTYEKYHSSSLGIIYEHSDFDSNQGPNKNSQLLISASIRF